MDICADLAARLGLDGYKRVDELEWLREICAGTDVDDFDTFRERGLARLPAPADPVAFADEVRDPAGHPFSTPTGKIEIYSTSIAANPDPYGLGRIPPIPTWIPPHADDPRHPLELISPKSRARTHSTHDNQPLARADRQDVWIHPDDAAARGIVDGQMVRVFNERGATILPARVTERIARGRGVDQGRRLVHARPRRAADTRGCANVLTEDRASPCGAPTYNTCRVEIAPA